MQAAILDYDIIMLEGFWYDPPSLSWGCPPLPGQSITSEHLRGQLQYNYIYPHLSLIGPLVMVGNDWAQLILIDCDESLQWWIKMEIIGGHWFIVLDDNRLCYCFIVWDGWHIIMWATLQCKILDYPSCQMSHYIWSRFNILFCMKHWSKVSDTSVYHPSMLNYISQRNKQKKCQLRLLATFQLLNTQFYQSNIN